MNDIYLKIKSIRLKKNLTQEDVSKRLGMAQSNYARMERGLSQITVERLGEIAEVFEMSPEAVMMFSDEPGDFREDAQFYFGQVKKLEAKVRKLEDALKDQEESDTDSYTNREAERKKLTDKLKELNKDLIFKETIILGKDRAIEKLEKEIEEKNKSINYLQNSNNKLLELLSKN
jgi:transcriptional regulator with XRE-family HTH domain